MKHCGTQRIETDSLILRKYVNEDAAAMYKNWASDKEVTKYLMWPAHSKQEIGQGVIDDWVNQYSSEKYYHWEKFNPLSLLNPFYKFSRSTGVKKASNGILQLLTQET